MWRPGALGAWLLALGVLFLLGCQPASKPIFKGTNLEGATFGRTLELTDHNGTHRGLKDFAGKLVVLFFGYTHCPDVCPTTLSDMAAAMELLTPEEASDVQVLFVSVDPERDTPDMLKEYVPYFYPSFLGLHGSPQEVAAAAKEFRVFYSRHEEPGNTGYLVDHTAGSYVLDRNGRLKLFMPYAQSAQDIAHDLRLLLAARE